MQANPGFQTALGDISSPENGRPNRRASTLGSRPRWAMSPALRTERRTIVRQEFLEVGSRSLALLLHRLRSENDEPVEHVVEPVLLVRASTAPPATN